MQRSIIFFGNERLASGCTTDLPVLNAVQKSHIKIDLIILSQKKLSSANQKELEVEKFAKEHHIEVFIPKSTQDLKTKIAKHQTDLALLAAYGKIIPQEIIEIFPKGIINLHPSLLPKYRGPTPIESAILNGDSETGVSIISLTSGMDSGPVYKQVGLKLNGEESKQELADKLGILGAQEITKILTSKTLPSTTRQTGSPVLCKLIQKSDSKLDLTKPATQLIREVRAHLNWPGSKLELKLKNKSKLDLTITKANTITEDNQKRRLLIIKTARGCLNIEKLKLPGKKEMSGKDFINGYRDRLELPH